TVPPASCLRRWDDGWWYAATRQAPLPQGRTKPRRGHDSVVMLVRCCSFTSVRCAQCRIFGHNDLFDARRIPQRRLYTVENETRELLARRNEFPVGELGYVEIDVAMIEARAHFGREHAVEQPEIDDHTSFVIDRTAHRDVARIAVSVKTFARAQTKGLFVLLVRPIRPAIPMRSGERDAAGEQ